MELRRFATPTGDPCPRCIRADGTVEGDAGCGSCGCCLLLLEAAWPGAGILTDDPNDVTKSSERAR